MPLPFDRGEGRESRSVMEGNEHSEAVEQHKLVYAAGGTFIASDPQSDGSTLVLFSVRGRNLPCTYVWNSDDEDRSTALSKFVLDMVKMCGFRDQ